MAALLAGVVAGLAVAVPVGAVGALVVMTGAQRGFRVAAAAGLGAATVDGMYALVAVSGGAAVAVIARSVGDPLQVAAGVVLLVLGALMIRSGLRARSGADVENASARLLGSSGRAYLALLCITAVNPATVIYFVALVIGGQVSMGSGASSAIAFICGVALGSGAWQLLLAAGGAVLGGVLAGRRGRTWTALIGGGITVVLAVKTLAGW